MMNIEDKDVDSEHEPNFRIRAKLLSTSSGAGVNAGSKVNRAFATCDPLSELVWSPKNGVELKCANFRADDNRKPFLLWNVGLKPVVDQGNLTVSQMVLDANDIIIGKATVLKDSGGCKSFLVFSYFCVTFVHFVLMLNNFLFDEILLNYDQWRVIGNWRRKLINKMLFLSETSLFLNQGKKLLVR